MVLFLVFLFLSIQTILVLLGYCQNYFKSEDRSICDRGSFKKIHFNILVWCTGLLFSGVWVVQQPFFGFCGVEAVELQLMVFKSLRWQDFGVVRSTSVFFWWFFGSCLVLVGAAYCSFIFFFQAQVMRHGYACMRSFSMYSSTSLLGVFGWGVLGSWRSVYMRCRCLYFSLCLSAVLMLLAFYGRE